jgi:hypothetical protein
VQQHGTGFLPDIRAQVRSFEVADAEIAASVLHVGATNQENDDPGWAEAHYDRSRNSAPPRGVLGPSVGAKLEHDVTHSQAGAPLGVAVCSGSWGSVFRCLLGLLIVGMFGTMPCVTIFGDSARLPSGAAIFAALCALLFLRAPAGPFFVALSARLAARRRS